MIFDRKTTQSLNVQEQAVQLGQVGPFRGPSGNDWLWGVSVFRGGNHLLSNSA